MSTETENTPQTEISAKPIVVAVQQSPLLSAPKRERSNTQIGVQPEVAQPLVPPQPNNGDSTPSPSPSNKDLASPTDTVPPNVKRMVINPNNPTGNATPPPPPPPTSGNLPPNTPPTPGGGESTSGQQPPNTEKTFIAPTQKKSLASSIPEMFNVFIAPAAHRSLQEVDMPDVNNFIDRGILPPQLKQTIREVNEKNAESIKIKPDESKLWADTFQEYMDYKGWGKADNPETRFYASTGALLYRLTTEMVKNRKQTEDMIYHAVRSYRPEIFENVQHPNNNQQQGGGNDQQEPPAPPTSPRPPSSPQPPSNPMQPKSPVIEYIPNNQQKHQSHAESDKTTVVTKKVM